MREAGRQPRQRRHLLLGAARAARGRVRLRLARPSCIDLLHAQRHRASTSAPRPRRRPPGSSPTYPRRPRRHPRRRRARLRLARHGVAQLARRTARRRRGSPSELAQRYGRAPRGRAVARAQRVRRARRRGLLGRVGRARSATGCRSATARSTRSTTRGAPRSGASATATGSTSARPPSRPASSTPRSASTSPGSPTTSCAQCFIAERDAIRAHADAADHDQLHGATSARRPTCGRGRREVDIVSNDHYLHGRRRARRTSASRSPPTSPARSRGGKPWILMEHSTSAVNWQPRNVAKRPGEMARNALAHLGRGADAHPVLPVARLALGRREVPLGDAAARRHRLAGVARGRRPRRRPRPARARCAARACTADVAILWDCESFWAQDLEWRPSRRRSTTASASAPSTSGSGATASRSTSPTPRHDLSGVPARGRPGVVPADRGGRGEPHRLRRPAAARCSSRTSPAIVDENDAVHAGGFVAPLRDGARA